MSALAADIGATAQRLSNWRKRGVPADQCPAIERATGGAVRCEDLRPDVDWAVLRSTPTDTSVSQAIPSAVEVRA